ncbi:class II aldolase/adducin family protein [Klebsiella pneumoniae]|uniref:Class II aldolase/adducin family protein n=1 Tax=Klebsiella pneumoniae TaxID=573 RepID=A0A923J779_KLEPN|nr:class II aldolase/adducin family protein [Klebsiella pneumoniae]
MYRLFPEANVVLHVHTVNATVLSRIEKRHAGAAGMKCRKPLAGSIAISIPFRSPSSIMTVILTPGGADCRLCANAPAALRLSLRGHGLTCWGKIFRRPAVNWRGWSSCSSAS